MWTFTKYLSDQVTELLTDLDYFLKRIEPEIESITGEERDTASFMKMMRIFNEVRIRCFLEEGTGTGSGNQENGKFWGDKNRSLSNKLKQISNVCW